MSDQSQLSRFRHDDLFTYWKFTGPQRLEKALHTLAGLLTGVTADGRVSADECALLDVWVRDYEEFETRHPFNEMLPRLKHVIAERADSAEELKEVLWLCQKMLPENGYFDAATSELQQLQGILAGMAADGIISIHELRDIQTWAEEHSHLKGCWPFDEIDATVTKVLADGIIDPREQEHLNHVFREFLSLPSKRCLSKPCLDALSAGPGICAVAPDIRFPEKRFCFTGTSMKGPRGMIADLVISLGGEFVDTVRRDLNYLVVGAGGNRAWAYSCYGRKVEQAVELRKNGLTVVIAHENDFWDAVKAAGR